MKIIDRMTDDVANAVSKAFSHVEVTEYTPTGTNSLKKITKRTEISIVNHGVA